MRNLRQVNIVAYPLFLRYGALKRDRHGFLKGVGGSRVGVVFQKG